LVQDVLEALKLSRRLTVLDLSLEAGQFPVTMLASAPRRTEIQFFGVDQDPIALRLTRKLYGFSQKYSRNHRFSLSLTCRDSLFNPLPSGWPREFDAIIGNPPWAAQRKNYTEHVRAAYRPLLSDNFDLYLAFMLRADSLLRPGGLLGMVVPSPFLFNDSGRAVRKYLLDRYDVLCLRIYPRRSFVEVPCIVPVSLLLSKRMASTSPRRDTLIAYDPTERGGAERPRTSIVCDARTYWQGLPGQPFHPWVRPDSRDLRHVETQQRLGDFGVVMDGAGLRGEDGVSAETGFKGFQARDIRPFHACENASLTYTNQRRFGRPPRSRDIHCRKVLFQNFRFITHSRRLVAAAGEPGSYGVSTASMFFPSDPGLTDYWTAILNSAVANGWFKLRDVSRRIKIDLVREIPVPMASEAVPAVTALSRECADLRLDLHRTIEKCTLTEEDRILQARCPVLFSRIRQAEATLDDLLFDLYKVPSRQRKTLLDLSTARVF
jgi:hypothetical protein